MRRALWSPRHCPTGSSIRSARYDGSYGRGVGVVAAEQSVEVLGVLIVFVDDERCVRVRGDVLAEVQLVGQDVVDHPAEERDVSARAQRHVPVGDGAGAGEPRVDVHDLRAAHLGLHHPLERHRMGLGQCRSP